MLEKIQNMLPAIKKSSVILSKNPTPKCTALNCDEFILSSKIREKTQNKINGCRIGVKKVLNFFDLRNKPINFFKGLSKDEKEVLKKGINSYDDFLFWVFKWGKKPSIVISGDEEILKICEKLEQKNANMNVLSIASFERGDKRLLFLLNKKMVCDIIKNNKKVFTQRLGLKENSTLEEIYSALADKNGLLARKGVDTSQDFNDITGLTLGFPKFNSMIFELERRMPKCIDINNINEYKKAMLDVLYGKNSPYKNMGSEFIEALSEKIKSIKEREMFNRKMESKGYSFVSFVDEPKEIERILSY